MKKTFRQYHLLKALSAYDQSSLPLDVSLGNYFKHNRALGSKDRKYVAETTYSMIRWMGLIDHFCQESHAWDERCRIHESLNIEKSLKDTTIPLHIRASFPKFFFQLLQKHYGDETALKLCLDSNTPAPTTVRVNILKTNRQKLLRLWKEKFGVITTEKSVFGIVFPQRLNFQTLDEFKKGFFEVQDEASQLVAGLVDAEPGDQVLDFCAGSGGKTLAFAHKLQGTGQVYLHDIRKGALQEAKRRLKRAGIENCQTLHCDSPQRNRLKGKMDWVLVDAPCSGSGTLRRNPDLKWKFTKEMLDRIRADQQAIFQEALSYLKPGGKIVYATCSILPEENEEQILLFQEKMGLDLAAKPFRTLPKEGGMDGFYAAVLKHRS